jgi:hypothetical protein
VEALAAEGALVCVGPSVEAGCPYEQRLLHIGNTCGKRVKFYINFIYISYF